MNVNYPQKLYVYWDKYYQLVDKLAEKIKQSNCTFDAFIAIGRGGTPLGDRLSRIFKDKTLGVIMADSYHGPEGNQKGKLAISEHIAITANNLGKRIILLDDMVESGDTLQKVKNKIEKENPGIEVLTAVIWSKAGASFTPTFCVAENVPKETWIYQPFEMWDKQSAEREMSG